MSRDHHLINDVVEPARRMRILTMAAYYEVMGVHHLRHRAGAVTGAPKVISGYNSDHRPDITCQGADSRSTWILCDVVLAADLLPEVLKETHDRLLLFWSAVHSNNAAGQPTELHLVVEHAKMKNGLTMGREVREKCEKWGIMYKLLQEI